MRKRSPPSDLGRNGVFSLVLEFEGKPPLTQDNDVTKLDKWCWFPFMAGQESYSPGVVGAQCLKENHGPPRNWVPLVALPMRITTDRWILVSFLF